MAEDVKVGGIKFDINLGMDTFLEQLDEATKDMKKHAKDAETIFNREWKAISDVQRKVQAELNNSTDRAHKQTLQGYVNTMSNIKKELKKSFKEIEAYSKTLDLKDAAPEVKVKAVKDKGKIDVGNEQLSADIEILRLREEEKITNEREAQYRISREATELEKDINRLRGSAQSEVTEAELKVLTYRKNQLTLEYNLSKGKEHNAQIEITALNKALEIRREMFKVQLGLSKAQASLGIDKGDTQAKKDILLLTKKMESLSKEKAVQDGIVRVATEQAALGKASYDQSIKTLKAEEQIAEAKRFAASSKAQQGEILDKAHYQAIQEEVKRTNKIKADFLKDEAAAYKENERRNKVQQRFLVDNEKLKREELEITRQAAKLAELSSKQEHEASSAALKDAREMAKLAERKNAINSDDSLGGDTKEALLKGVNLEEQKLAIARERASLQDMSFMEEKAHATKILAVKQKELELERQIIQVDKDLALNPNDNKAAEQARALEYKREELIIERQTAQVALEGSNDVLASMQRELNFKEQELAIEREIATEQAKTAQRKQKELAQEEEIARARLASQKDASNKDELEAIKLKKQELEIQERINNGQANQNIKNLEDSRNELKYRKQMIELEGRRTALNMTGGMTDAQRANSQSELDLQEKLVELERQKGVLESRNAQVDIDASNRSVAIAERDLAIEREIARVKLQSAGDPSNEGLREEQRQLELQREQLAVEEQQSRIETEASRNAIRNERVELDVMQDQLEISRAQNAAERNALGETQRGVQGTSNAMNGVRNALVGIASVMGGRKLYEWLIGTPADYERTVNSIGLLINDAERAKTLTDDLKTLAFETPYNLLDLTQTASTLSSTSMYVSEIEELIPRIASLSRGNADIMKQVTKATMDISNAGKVMGQEMNQLKDAGVPIIPEMARTMGITVMQFRKAVEEGRVTSEIYVETLERMTNEGGKFYGILDMYADDYLGRLEQLKGKLIEFGMDVGDKALPILSDGFQVILDRLDELEASGKLDTIVEEWSTALVALSELVLTIGTFLAENPGIITGAAKLLGLAAGLFAFTKGLKGVAGVMTTVGAPTAVAAGNMSKLATAGASLTRMIPILAVAIGGIAVIIDVWGDAFKEVGNAMDRLEARDALELKVKEGKNLEYFNDLIKAMDELKEKEDELEETANQTAVSFGETFRALKEINSVYGNLSEVDLDKQRDMLLKLEELGFNTSIFDFDEVTGKITNFEEALRKVDVSDAVADSVTSGFKQSLDFYEKEMGDVIARLSKDGAKKLTVGNMEAALGRDVQQEEVDALLDKLGPKATLQDVSDSYIKLAQDGKKYYEEQHSEIQRVTTASQGLKSSYGELSNVTDTFFGDLIANADEAISKMESFNKVLQNNADSSFTIVADLDDTELQKRWKAIQASAKSGGPDVTAKFTAYLDTEGLKSGEGEIDAVSKDYMASFDAAKGYIETALKAGEINLSQAELALSGITEKMQEDITSFGTAVASSAEYSEGTVSKLYSDVQKLVTGTDETLATWTKSQQDRAATIGVELVAKGFGTEGDVKDVLATLGKTIEETEKKEELKQKLLKPEKYDPVKLANDAYGLLKRQFEVELITIEDFRKRAEAVRSKYFKSGTLDYLEYSKTIEDAVEAHNEMLAKKEEERLEKLKEGLDKQLSLSSKYIEGMSYKRSINNEPFIKSFEQVKQREYQAYKEGVQTFEEYQDSMEQIGEVAYSARSRQHQDYLKNQERANKWSYGEQTAYYQKMQGELTASYRKGLIDFVRYNEELSSLQDSMYDARYSELERLMEKQKDSVTTMFDNEVKAINDAYDKINRKKDDDDRKERLKELIRLEGLYANAVSKEGQDRLKEIKDEIKGINDEFADQKLADERDAALAKADKDRENALAKQEKAWSSIGSIALDASKDIGKAAESIMNSFKKVSNFDLMNPYSRAGVAGGKVAPTLINNNTFNVKTTSQALQISRQTNDFNVVKQMAKGK